MKKIRAIKYIGILLFILYIVVIIIAYTTKYFGNMNNLYFSIVLASVSLTMCFKGAILKSYSTLWFAISLILYALLIIYFEIRNISYKEFNYIFAFLPVVTSLLLLLLGRKVYLKVIILNLSIAIPILLYNIFDLELWLNIGIFIVSVIIGVLLCRTLSLGKEKI